MIPVIVARLPLESHLGVTLRVLQYVSMIRPGFQELTV